MILRSIHVDKNKHVRNLQLTIDDVIANLDRFDSLREEVIKMTRKLNRCSGRGIAKIIKGEDCETLLINARELMEKIAGIMKIVTPLISWRTTISGVEEYGEFEILHAIVSNQPLPDPDSLKIPHSFWLTALGDVFGEIRRIILNKLIENEIDEAKVYLLTIQEIYEIIAGLDYSKSLIPNLRHKIDSARAVVERTESDFTNALQAEKITNALKSYQKINK